MRRFSRRSLLRSIGVAGLGWAGTSINSPLRGWSTEGKPPDSVKPLVAGSPFDVSMVDIAASAGLHAVGVCGEEDRKHWIIETTGCGITFFDYDDDGWLDIFMVNATTLKGFPKGEEPTNHMYHNNRDGTFKDVTVDAGLRRTGWGQAVCVGDYDNDGFDDLFVTYWGENVLYHNNGDGTFTDVTEKAGLLQRSSRPRWNTGCSFIDYDRDGHLDLFVANYLDLDLSHTPAAGSGTFCQYQGVPVLCGPRGLPFARNILYHNNGDGTFTDVSGASTVAAPLGHYSFTPLTGDFDNDGWPDIYVSCDSTPSLLYHNNHNGTFSEIAATAGCALNEDGLVQAGMGVSAGDYDGDGWLDLIKTNFSNETSTLYHNERDGTFADVTLAAGLGINSRYLGWGCGFVDLDNDGWLDIFLANGHIYPGLEKAGLDTPFREPKIVYRNLRNGRFEDRSMQTGPGVLLKSSARGVAFGDFDNDGDVDVIINNMHDPPILLRNDCGSQNCWLKIKAIGTHSNRSAIGARVRVVTGQRVQISEVRSGGSYLSQNDLRLHFGLGQARKADLIQVNWPSGKIDTVKDVEGNRIVTIKEGSGIINFSRSSIYG